MSFNGFMTFDPYLTFAEGERGFRERIFLRPDGTPTSSWYSAQHDGQGYLSSLWRAGREAYATVAETIGTQPKIQDFLDIAAVIKEVEMGAIPTLEELIGDGRLILTDEIGSPLATSLEQCVRDSHVGWLLEIYMRILRPGVVAGDLSADKLPDFEGLLAAAAVMQLDDYIIAEQIDAEDLDGFHHALNVSIASARLYKETVSIAREAISARGRRSANARHRPTNQKKAAILAEWDAFSGEYRSRADFARIVSDRESLKERTLYDWIAAHEKNKD